MTLPAKKHHLLIRHYTAFLPFKHIDHLHPDAGYCYRGGKRRQAITADLFKGVKLLAGMACRLRSLALQLLVCLDANLGIRRYYVRSAMGCFTLAISYESYINTLEVIEQCAEYLEQNYGKKDRFPRRLQNRQSSNAASSKAGLSC